MATQGVTDAKSMPTETTIGRSLADWYAARGRMRLLDVKGLVLMNPATADHHAGAFYAQALYEKSRLP